MGNIGEPVRREIVEPVPIPEEAPAVDPSPVTPERVPA